MRDRHQKRWRPACLANRPPAWYAFLGTGPTDYDKPGLDAVQSLSQRFETLIDELLSEIAQLVRVDYEPLWTLPCAVVTMVDGTFMRWLSDPSPARSRDQLVRDVADYAWYMLDGAARRRVSGPTATQ